MATHFRKYIIVSVGVSATLLDSSEECNKISLDEHKPYFSSNISPQTQGSPIWAQPWILDDMGHSSI